MIPVERELLAFGAVKVKAPRKGELIKTTGSPPVSDVSVQASYRRNGSALRFWLHSYADDSGDVLVSFVGDGATFYRMQGWVFADFAIENGYDWFPVNSQA